MFQLYETVITKGCETGLDRPIRSVGLGTGGRAFGPSRPQNHHAEADEPNIKLENQL
jgi:hypothetical protein